MLNKIFIMGRLTRDPELRRTASDALRYGLSALRGDSIL